MGKRAGQAKPTLLTPRLLLHRHELKPALSRVLQPHHHLQRHLGEGSAEGIEYCAVRRLGPSVLCLPGGDKPRAGTIAEGMIGLGFRIGQGLASSAPLGRVEQKAIEAYSLVIAAR